MEGGRRGGFFRPTAPKPQTSSTLHPETEEPIFLRAAGGSQAIDRPGCPAYNQNHGCKAILLRKAPRTLKIREHLPVLKKSLIRLMDPLRSIYNFHHGSTWDLKCDNLIFFQQSGC